MELQHTWVYENITYGVVNETKEDMLGYVNDYFYIALDSEKVVGYITAEVVGDYERIRSLNICNPTKPHIWPWGAKSFRLTDLDGNIIMIRSWPKQD